MPRTPRPLLAAAAAALLLLGAAACGDDGVDEASAAEVTTTAPEAADAGAGVRVVSPAEAAALLDADPAPAVIDVRTPEEFEAGHLEGAVLIDVTSPDFEAQVAELDRDQPYVLYCRSGNRSVTARQVMSDLGFTDVADIGGGITAWVAEGQPVVT
ncbi:rhodanese-like domain-containing protein [Acidimicrobiia bacterium EGI L10123]|uniref:rhodanese-like domain-containing protein n=1 Tax=Salinilacustrithrix flava TaxID=2957203 RepID=UPI003D7C2E69|nr:rhodanese-like domain-containing protein [Acidimicrobiia bacterium EGI L10123]